MEAKKNEGERWRIESHSGVSWFARILHRMVICVRLKRKDLVERCSTIAEKHRHDTCIFVEFSILTLFYDVNLRYFAFNIILYYIHIHGWIKRKLRNERTTSCKLHQSIEY